ncbi:MAG: XRE family transcriptional regulator [Ruminococcus sp.]|nr:XRE family transcriptional regulator [Ruminococcus sp.]
MFYDNLKTACDQKGLKITPLVAECGGAKGSISNWKKGASPNSDIVAKLAVRLNVSTDFLIFGKEYSLTPNLSKDEQELLSYFKELNDKDKGRILGNAQALSGALEKQLDESKNTIFIETYLLPVSAGTGIYLDNCDREMLEVEENDLTLEANFALRVSGDSMEPDFKNGDVLLIRSQPTVEIGEIGIFILDGEGFVKEFGGDCLISHNKKYENIKLEKYNEIYCRGLVLGVLEDEQIV